MSFAPFIKEISYFTDTSRYFEIIRPLKHPIWLDSCQSPERAGSPSGRYDIFSACPTHYLQTTGANTKVQSFKPFDELITADARPASVENFADDPFALVERYLPNSPPAMLADNESLPMCGGAIGFFGYDLAHRLERLPRLATRDSSLPDMAIGIYPWTVIVDHARQKAYITAKSSEYGEAPYRYLNHHLNLKQFLEKPKEPFKISVFESFIKANSYFEKFDAIHKYIYDGDVYQVNFAQRFQAQFSGDPLVAYLHLRQINPAPFAGYIPLSSGAIISLSPERFIACDGDRVTTSPIKGTIARGASVPEDKKAADTLVASRKDQAENLMIVDLLRNDLSQTCNQVSVPRLFELQSFTNVHHLVSTIEARLKPGHTALSLLRAAFPGGSITGAPKIRAMEIIESLESHGRGPYCGSLGYISSCGKMDTSITIRTLVAEGQRITCWGGGGIVADSDAQSEYQESITKVAILLRSLESEFGEA
ncbi:aminodeoxychorismate synthase component I [Gilvimarinus sp. SDUM040013]|uniref:aminodeoxychorismate synthase n=1 Tax=Gilvimarinus gilvus TaxID=3058038 RepID=A0ABU4RWP3_9GAMM|nr:aminodeoxychorismate synthase component I [Gilvimarinus sp. SDUM040013]MDO3385672.1 aminodeoxychorismate synthase component I [Gilvimarinus sp. SDUM040013]MDX6849310.1 aminodeoxychorismate synthase component I [Gilvimarinus sp. SDUM040013]